jgi:DNA-binding transcriptional regulator YdaS (Cro superfamily)
MAKNPKRASPPAFQRFLAKRGTAANLARALGVFPQHVHNWQMRGVPEARCLDIERATYGAVTRYDLRPDVFGKAGMDPKLSKRKH